MVYLLDIAVVFVFIASALGCYHKGFVKTLLSLFTTLIAVILAVVVANNISDSVYEKYLHTKIVGYTNQLVENVDISSIISDELASRGIDVEIDGDELAEYITRDGEIADNVAAYYSKQGVDGAKANEIRDEIDNYLSSENLSTDLADNDKSLEIITGLVNNEKENVTQLIKSLASDDKGQAAVIIESELLAPIITIIVKIVLIIILIIIFEIVINILIFAFGIANKFAISSDKDKTMGLILGLIRGLVEVAFLALICCAIITSTANTSSWLNTDIIDDTILFKIFFNVFY